VIGLFVLPLPARAREQLLVGLVVAFLGRTAALSSMLFVCGGSFWTALRVVGDLPFALLGNLVATGAWLAVRYSSRSPSSSSSTALARSSVIPNHSAS